MRRGGIGADDDHAVIARAAGLRRRSAQRVGQRVQARAGVDSGLVDRVATVGSHGNNDFFRVIALLLGIGHRQGQLQFGEFAVGGGQHQKDEDHQQHVDERNQVDFRLIARFAGAEVHKRFREIYLRSCDRWRKKASDDSSSVSR